MAKNAQIEKTLPLEKVFAPSLANKQDLVKIAFKCFERGMIQFADYAKICEQNNQLIF